MESHGGDDAVTVSQLMQFGMKRLDRGDSDITINDSDTTDT